MNDVETDIEKDPWELTDQQLRDWLEFIAECEADRNPAGGWGMKFENMTHDDNNWQGTGTCFGDTVEIVYQLIDFHGADLSKAAS